MISSTRVRPIGGASLSATRHSARSVANQPTSPKWLRFQKRSPASAIRRSSASASARCAFEVDAEVLPPAAWPPRSDLGPDRKGGPSEPRDRRAPRRDRGGPVEDGDARHVAGEDIGRHGVVGNVIGGAVISLVGTGVALNNYNTIVTCWRGISRGSAKKQLALNAKQ